ncbi:uncharacterized protein RHOBADRAFT_51184, partial [Rhodotorula graminis WP1]
GQQPVHAPGAPGLDSLVAQLAPLPHRLAPFPRRLARPRPAAAPPALVSPTQTLNRAPRRPALAPAPAPQRLGPPTGRRRGARPRPARGSGRLAPRRPPGQGRPRRVRPAPPRRRDHPPQDPARPRPDPDRRRRRRRRSSAAQTRRRHGHPGHGHAAPFPSHPGRRWARRPRRQPHQRRHGRHRREPAHGPGRHDPPRVRRERAPHECRPHEHREHARRWEPALARGRARRARSALARARRRRLDDDDRQRREHGERAWRRSRVRHARRGAQRDRRAPRRALAADVVRRRRVEHPRAVAVVHDRRLVLVVGRDRDARLGAPLAPPLALARRAPDAAHGVAERAVGPALGHGPRARRPDRRPPARERGHPLGHECHRVAAGLGRADDAYGRRVRPDRRVRRRRRRRRRSRPDVRRARRQPGPEPGRPPAAGRLQRACRGAPDPAPERAEPDDRAEPHGGRGRPRRGRGRRPDAHQVEGRGRAGGGGREQGQGGKGPEGGVRHGHVRQRVEDQDRAAQDRPVRLFGPHHAPARSASPQVHRRRRVEGVQAPARRDRRRRQPHQLPPGEPAQQQDPRQRVGAAAASSAAACLGPGILVDDQDVDGDLGGRDGRARPDRRPDLGARRDLGRRRIVDHDAGDDAARCADVSSLRRRRLWVPQRRVLARRAGRGGRRRRRRGKPRGGGRPRPGRRRPPLVAGDPGRARRVGRVGAAARRDRERLLRRAPERARRRLDAARLPAAAGLGRRPAADAPGATREGPAQPRGVRDAGQRRRQLDLAQARPLGHQPPRGEPDQGRLPQRRRHDEVQAQVRHHRLLQGAQPVAPLALVPTRPSLAFHLVHIALSSRPLTLVVSSPVVPEPFHLYLARPFLCLPPRPFYPFRPSLASSFFLTRAPLIARRRCATALVDR